MIWFWFIISSSVCLFSNIAQTADVAKEENNTEIIYENGVILSRRKRFIIFPEGSSLQLVFCSTYPLVSPIGDIILFGTTAALAFELPQDPYSPFDHHADPLHRRVDSKTIYFTDDAGKVLFKRPYKRKPIINPAFAKRSAPDDRSDDTRRLEKGTREKYKIDREQMHVSKSRRNFLKIEHMDRRSVEFHRSSRASLYNKIETFLEAKGGDGKECVLKTLCMIGQSENSEQSGFFQEIMRAVFTFPVGVVDDSGEYERAYVASEPCDELYYCTQHIQENA